MKNEMTYYKNNMATILSMLHSNQTIYSKNDARGTISEKAVGRINDALLDALSEVKSSARNAATPPEPYNPSLLRVPQKTPPVKAEEALPTGVGVGIVSGKAVATQMEDGSWSIEATTPLGTILIFTEIHPSQMGIISQ